MSAHVDLDGRASVMEAAHACSLRAGAGERAVGAGPRAAARREETA
jgi:hypothetical protein